MLHNDQPVLDDTLARLEIVSSVAAVAATCTAPVVLGVHGDWGIGKTSMLHQLYCTLSGKCPTGRDVDEKVQKRLHEMFEAKLPAASRKRLGESSGYADVSVVWFEAWRYQHETQPVVALLHEIRNQLSDHHRAFHWAQKTISTAVRGALLSIEEVTKKIGFQASKIEQAGKEWEAAHYAVPVGYDAIRKVLEEAISALLPDSPPLNDKPAPRRVVVIIDDLDRCDPDGAYKLLEGLKLYLSLPNCVFVLGMNQTVVEDAIAKVVPGSDKEPQLRRERAGAYLEKLCANIWRVPPVADPAEYLVSLMPEEKPKVRSEFCRWLALALETSTGEKISCLPRNPRRLKALANLLIRTHMPEGIKEPLEAVGGADRIARLQEIRATLAVALVYQFHHDLFRYWQAHPELYAEHLRKWCEKGREAEPLPTPEKAADGKAGDDTPPAKRLTPVEEVLSRLRPPFYVTPTDSTGPKRYATSTTYPDPADTAVFWAQPLFLALEAEAPDGAFDHGQFELLFSRFHGVNLADVRL